MILMILIFSIFVNGERLRRTRRQNPTCIRDDLSLQPFSTWSCSGTPEKCSMNCNYGFERSDSRKGNLDRFECRKMGQVHTVRSILDDLLSQCRRSWAKLDGHCTKIGRFPGSTCTFRKIWSRRPYNFIPLGSYSFCSSTFCPINPHKRNWKNRVTCKFNKKGEASWRPKEIPVCQPKMAANCSTVPNHQELRNVLWPEKHSHKVNYEDH